MFNDHFREKKNRQVGLEIAERDLQIEIRKGILPYNQRTWQRFSQN